MKIAVAASGNHVRSNIDPHFGRCEWFCIFEPGTGEAEFVENTARNMEKAGCEAAGFLAGKGITMVIAGRFGSKAIEAFRAKNIQMIIPEKEMTIQEIINQIKNKA